MGYCLINFYTLTEKGQHIEMSQIIDGLPKSELSILEPKAEMHRTITTFFTG